MKNVKGRKLNKYTGFDYGSSALPFTSLPDGRTDERMVGWTDKEATIYASLFW